MARGELGWSSALDENGSILEDEVEYGSSFDMLDPENSMLPKGSLEDLWRFGL